MDVQGSQNDLGFSIYGGNAPGEPLTACLLLPASVQPDPDFRAARSLHQHCQIPCSGQPDPYISTARSLPQHCQISALPNLCPALQDLSPALTDRALPDLCPALTDRALPDLCPALPDLCPSTARSRASRSSADRVLLSAQTAMAFLGKVPALSPACFLLEGGAGGEEIV
ncbi:hypothetical protein NDU88_005046 [Pleurodeles waltl]|uniref:Uncharacterized protein n=1 Tax=Pleurodeles waltl TaxID=8319 RepID=A0AAV7KZI6_PLEWA|nr:hypothetical protein NDU88_005046 [Pleurodeles waltl]